MRHFLVLLSILSTLGQASAGTVWGTVTPGEAPPAAPVHPDTCFWRLGSGHPSPADWGQMFVVLEGEPAWRKPPRNPQMRFCWKGTRSCLP
jgi:hypothetical protein